MDGHERNDALTDSPLDRELGSLLAAEPSPEFVARVRTRVAQESGPSSWRMSWMFAAAGVVAVVIVAIAVWPSNQPTPAREEPVPQVARAVEKVAPQSSPAPEPVPRLARPRAAAVVAARDSAVEIDLPEVVIAENEVRTFAALVASVRQSRFDVTVPAAPDPDKPLEIKELPPVEPLEIEPIVKVAALQAEGERP